MWSTIPLRSGKTSHKLEYIKIREAAKFLNWWKLKQDLKYLNRKKYLNNSRNYKNKTK